MSYLTEVLLFVNGLITDPARAALTAPVPDDEREQSLELMDTAFSRVSTEYAGGTKVFCSEVYAACFNHFPAYRVVPWLSNLDLGPYHVRLIAVVDCEGEKAPFVWSNKEIELRGWAPPESRVIQGEVVGQRTQPVRLTRARRKAIQ
jgi:hypothetical protein